MTVKQYVLEMLQRQVAIGRKFGADISTFSKQLRVLNMSILVLLAVVIKTLTDKGVITDAELLTTLNAARGDDYDDEPVDPIPAP